MKPKKILIVEDDKMLCTIFDMFIQELGYINMGVAQKGKDAIEKCRADKPDVVLMDIHLEGDLDGIETAEELQDQFDIPVIFISSDMEEETFQRAILPNTYGFLAKPIYKTNLGLAIEYAHSKHLLDKSLQN